MDREQTQNRVILVDENDREVGQAPKLAAHENGGKLHRAFSVFVFNPSGQLLLQKRSARKYHFGGLWTNSCCSHPRPGETIAAAAEARVFEELGVRCSLQEIFSFVYRASDLRSGLTEHEFDHVLIGEFDGQPTPNPEEVDDWRWAWPSDVLADFQHHPELYSPWFKLSLQRVVQSLQRRRP